MRQLNAAQPLTAAAFRSLREAICTGELPPGARLKQSELAERLGVSRLPVHEALQELRREGFVTETGRRGLVVSPLEADFVLQLFELRAALDRTAGRSAARCCAEGRGAGVVERGVAAVERGRRGLARRSLLAIAAADHAFHGLIYRLGGNALIAAAAERNWHHVRRAFLSLVTVTPELAAFWEDHAAILRAVAAGEEERAGALCWEHAMRSGLGYAAALRGGAGRGALAAGGSAAGVAVSGG